jgi:hypothetical protein
MENSDHKWLRIGKHFLLIAAGTILFLILLELGLHAAYALVPKQLQEDMRFSLSPYKDKPWATELYNDEVKFGNLPTVWDRYDEWKRPPITSSYINTDSDGRRNTWNPRVATGTKLAQIWFLGGSSTFGAGARDSYTIPSDFSKIVNANGAAYQVSNYGTYAYVFPQSVIQFVKLLEAGQRPDYVVFYGGSAEVDAAYDAGDGGALSMESLWKSRIQPSVLDQAKVVSKELLRDYCLTCRLAVNFARSIDSGALRVSTIVGMTYNAAQLDALAQSIVDNYIGTLNFVDHLAAAYHFKYMAIWEPSPFGDRLVGDEQKLTAADWRLSDKNNAYLYTKTVALLNKKVPAHFWDLSGLLKSRTTMMFLDDVHISEEGDQIVATKLADIFMQQTQ